MTAQFLIESTFRIRGRGLVVAGKTVSGTIEEGMTFTLPTIDEPMVIESVKMIRSVQPTRYDEGLFCKEVSEENQAAWSNLDISGLEITVG
ncbi:MAG: hypothetical protein DHS20C16_26470 [Phycisphaerae bacterium]|nr:MAG: hypothetical protein DHS20C16_26470 [Phycisphaerae bacterium]